MHTATSLQTVAAGFPPDELFVRQMNSMCIDQDQFDNFRYAVAILLIARGFNCVNQVPMSVNIIGKLKGRMKWVRIPYLS